MSAGKNLSPGVQARFVPDEFTRFIEQHGLEYRWSRAVICPCQLNPDTGQPSVTCARCLDGWMYVNPCYATERHLSRDYSRVKAVFSSITFDFTSHEYVASPWTTGEGMMTIDGVIRISFRDRFIAVEQRTTLSQLMIRTAASIIKVGWIGRTRDEQTFAFRYEPIDIHYVEDEDQVVYVKGVDFTILGATKTEPRRLEWKTGKGPDTKKKFSISYDCHPVWVVDDASFGVQNSIGPPGGLSGAPGLQFLPTTFKVGLDWLTEKRGT